MLPESKHPSQVRNVDLNNYEQRLRLVYLHGHLVERMAVVSFRLNKDRNISLKPVQNGFCYGSGDNDQFLSVTDLRDLIRKHVDPHFQPF